MNRNHYMALGTVLLLLGLTVFKVETVTLTEDSTRFLAQQMEQPEQSFWSPRSRSRKPSRSHLGRDSSSSAWAQSSCCTPSPCRSQGSLITVITPPDYFL